MAVAADDRGHYSIDYRYTLCGVAVAAAVSVRLRRQLHADNPCETCYDPETIREALAVHQAGPSEWYRLTPDVERLRAHQAAVAVLVADEPAPPERDEDHPLRAVWDLCERLDQAHADAVRPRPQETPA